MAQPSSRHPGLSTSSSADFRSTLLSWPVLELPGQCWVRGCSSSPSGCRQEARGAPCAANGTELTAAAQQGAGAVALGDNVSSEREQHRCSEYRCSERLEIFNQCFCVPKW